MDVSRETPDVTTRPKCYDLTNILVPNVPLPNIHMQLLRLRKDLRTGSIPRDIVNSPLRNLQPQKWHVYGCSTVGAAWLVSHPDFQVCGLLERPFVDA